MVRKRARSAKERGLRRMSGAGSLAETGPALWIFMLFIVLPFIDLISFAMGVSTVMFVSNWGARQAGPCNNFTDAKASVQQTEDGLKNFRNFAKMSPTNGGASGVEIKVQVSSISGSKKEDYTFEQRTNIPNLPPTDASNPIDPPVNTGNSVYQYVVTGAYDVSPLFNFSVLPFLKDVPALGKPVPVTYISAATVEHPEGLKD